MRRPVPFQPIYRAVRKPPPAGIGVDWTDPINKDLKGCWVLNEASGTIARDLSGNNNTATLGSLATWGAGGASQAVTFVGTQNNNNMITVGNSNSINIVGNISLVVWVYPKISNAFQCLFSRSNGTGGNRQYAVFLSSAGVTKIYLDFANGGQGDQVVTPNWATNKWNCIAVTADGTNIRIYVNGILAATKVSALLPTSQTYSLYLGQENSSSFALNGLLDIPRVFGRVLTAAEVARLYYEPFAGILTPRRRPWIGAAAVGGSFNPGWASGATKTIGAVF